MRLVDCHMSLWVFYPGKVALTVSDVLLDSESLEISIAYTKTWFFALLFLLYIRSRGA